MSENVGVHTRVPLHLTTNEKLPFVGVEISEGLLTNESDSDFCFWQDGVYRARMGRKLRILLNIEQTASRAGGDVTVSFTGQCACWRAFVPLCIYGPFK